MANSNSNILLATSTSQWHLKIPTHPIWIYSPTNEPTYFACYATTYIVDKEKNYGVKTTEERVIQFLRYLQSSPEFGGQTVFEISRYLCLQARGHRVFKISGCTDSIIWKHNNLHVSEFKQFFGWYDWKINVERALNLLKCAGQICFR